MIDHHFKLNMACWSDGLKEIISGEKRVIKAHPSDVDSNLKTVFSFCKFCFLRS